MWAWIDNVCLTGSYWDLKHNTRVYALDYGISLTWWHIILILWKEGCRLNRTKLWCTSITNQEKKRPWALTLRPLSSAQQSNHTEGRHPLVCCSRRSIPNKFLQIRNIERGNWQFYENVIASEIIKYQPRSGYVRFIAILLGTPTSSNSRFGSPVMTVRAEKSTRFPIKLRRPFLFLETSLDAVQTFADFADSSDKVVRVSSDMELERFGFGYDK